MNTSMIKSAALSMCLTASVSLAQEPALEINQYNCNLPMHKIRALIPNKQQQQDTMQRCIQKAARERWGKMNTIKQSTT